MNIFFNDNDNLSDFQFEDLTQSSDLEQPNADQDFSLSDTGQLDMLHQEPFNTELNLEQSDYQHQTLGYENYSNHSEINDDLMNGRNVQFKSDSTVYHVHSWQKQHPNLNDGNDNPTFGSNNSTSDSTDSSCTDSNGDGVCDD